MNDKNLYPDDDFNDKLYEKIFGSKLNKEIFQKTEEPKKEIKRPNRIKE